MSGDTMSSVKISRLMEKYGIRKCWSSAELSSEDVGIDYLVNEILVTRQPLVMAGPPKAMKTSVAVDLAISLGSGHQFLAQFQVPRPQRVLFLSAESGDGTIQETARRVAASKGFALNEECGVSWNSWVPKARNQEQLQILEFQLVNHRATVLVVDPLYKCLDGESQANLSANAGQIQSIVEVCSRHDVTPVFVDHVQKTSGRAKRWQPLQLGDVTGAGKAEFFRQWLLVSRREAFHPNRPHRLWMVAGGSAGHASQHRLNIDESRDGSGHRTWRIDTVSGGTHFGEVDDESHEGSATEDPFA